MLPSPRKSFSQSRINVARRGRTAQTTRSVRLELEQLEDRLAPNDLLSTVSVSGAATVAPDWQGCAATELVAPGTSEMRVVSGPGSGRGPVDVFWFDLEALPTPARDTTVTWTEPVPARTEGTESVDASHRETTDATERTDSPDLLEHPDKLLDSGLEDPLSTGELTREGPARGTAPIESLASEREEHESERDFLAEPSAEPETDSYLAENAPALSEDTFSTHHGQDDARLAANLAYRAANLPSARSSSTEVLTFAVDDGASSSNPANAAASQRAQPSAEQIQANGLVAMDWHGEQIYARPGEWIVSFAGVQGSANEQMAQVNAMLAQVQPGLTATQALGQDGLVEIHGSADTNIGTIQAALSQLPEYRYAEPNQALWVSAVPNDPAFTDGTLWGLQNTGQNGGTAGADISATGAWNFGTGSRSVVVGIIDTGIDYTHPDLAANIWTNPGEVAGDGIDNDANGYIDDIHGYDFVNNDGNPMDDNDHGTHVAGTIGGVGNDGQGVAGVNWQVSMMGLKFLGAGGSGTLNDAVRALNYVNMMRTTYGVNIVLTNNSWGGGGYSQALYDAINASAQANILFVAAAGNSASNNDSYPSYPASYNLNNIIAVAATDRNDQLASFSSYGVTSVDIAAPGVGIYSTVRGNSYATFNGTSMATPHVAGALALLSALNPALTATQLRDRLLARTDAVASLVGKVAGSGRLNARKLVDPSFTPAPAHLSMSGVTFADPAGNNDGFGNPGEVITVRPAFLNDGDTATANATVTITSTNPGATILGTTSLSLGTVNARQAGQPASSFQVQLASTLADLDSVSLQFTVQYGSTSQVFSYDFRVAKMMPQAQVLLNFVPGESVADPVRNIVYLIDKTNQKLLAIDTQLGQTVAQALLAGAPDITTTPVDMSTLRSGQVTVSRDGTRLFVALPSAKKIQVFALPDLAPLAVYSYDFAPTSIVHGVNDRLYVSTTDNNTEGFLRMIDAATGAVLGAFNKDGSVHGRYYPDALLRTNQAGTRLFAAETGLNTVGGPAYVYEYDITGTGLPVLVKQHPYNQVYLKDFAVDEVYQRIYTVSSGMPYGVQVTDMVTGTYGSMWFAGDAYGSGVALLPGGNFVYGASGGHAIRRFDRATGAPIGQYSAYYPNGYSPFLQTRSLEITPNGRLTYVAQTASTYLLGLIGSTSLTLAVTPRVLSSVRTGSNPTSASTAAFQVTFDTSVTGVDVSDFAVTSSTIVGASVVSVTPVSGSVYTVVVNTGVGSGTLRLDVIDNDSIRDLSGRPLGTLGLSNGNFYGGDSYTISRPDQQVRLTAEADALVMQQTGPNSNFGSNGYLSVRTYGGSLEESYLRFDLSSVTGEVLGAWLRLSPTTTAGAYSTTQLSLQLLANDTWVEGNGGSDNNPTGEITWNSSRSLTGPVVASWTGETAGVAREVNLTSVILDQLANDPAKKVSFRLLGSPEGSVIYYDSRESYTVAQRPQLVLAVRQPVAVTSITRDQASTTNLSTVSFLVNFNSTVTGVDASDFALTTSGITGAAVTGVTAVSGSQYRVTVNTGAGSGTLRLDVSDNDSIRDSLGNALGGTGVGNGNYTLGPAYTIDKAPPTVLSSVRASTNPTSAASVNYTVTFSETVTGVDASDFILTTTGLSGASVTGVTSLGSGRFTVTVNPGSGAGTLRLDVVDNDSIIDSPGNALGGTGAGNGSFITGETYNVNRPVAVASITRDQASTTNLASVSFLVTFNTTVTGVNAADFVLTTTGIAGAALTGVTAVSGSQYRVTVATGTGNGTLRLDVIDDDSIRDTLGNALGGPGAGNGNYTLGAVYTIDKTPPTVLSSVRASTNPTGAASVNFTVTFSETVTGVDVSDFAIAASGVTGASVASVTALSGSSYRVTVNTGAGNGTLGLNLIDNDSVRDSASNALGGAGTGNGSFTAGESFTINRALVPVALIPVADDWVQASAPTLNRGTDTWLGVAQGERETYLRFDLSTLSTVSSAHLRLTPAITGGAIASTTFQLELVADDGWGESTLNWNNKPVGSTVLATWTGETSGVVRDIDITSIVQQQLATDPGKKLSLRIVGVTINTGTNWVYYSSREDSAASRPQLVIQS